MGFRELPPHPALARVVAAFWTTEPGPGATAPARILPDGCFDLLFVLEGEVGAASGGTPLRPGAWLVGPMTRAKLVARSPDARVVAARLHPGVWSSHLGGDLEQLCDRTERADTVLGSRFLEWEDRIVSARSTAERAGLLDELLLGWLRGQPTRTPLLDACSLVASGASTGARSLADQVGLGERTLQRWFRREAGLSPRSLARIHRLNQAVDRLRSGAASLAAVALETGYADQAHFTREFTALAGISPRRFLAERAAAMSETFKTTAAGEAILAP